MDLDKRVLEIIASVLNQDISAVSSPEIRENLERAGMDSINAIQVMVVLEEEYGITFGEEDALEENFLQVARLTALIQKQLSYTNQTPEGTL